MPKSADIKNLNKNVLEQFKATRNGLLTPDGELVTVVEYEHFSELGKRPEFAQKVEEFNEWVRNQAQDFEDDIPEGEHPGWHVFECWKMDRESEFRTEVLDEAYQLGWGRIALAMKRPKPHLVELETNPGSVKALKPYAQCVAELCDANLTVHEVERFTRS